MTGNNQPSARMNEVRLTRIAVAALALGGVSALLIAPDTTSAATSHSAKKVVVSTVTISSVGTILASGKTLYTLKPSAAPCTAQCLKIWPAVELPKGVARATAGPGVNASKLGFVKRAGGLRQVTFAGKAVYWFIGDTRAGQANGNVTDKWGTWADVVLKKPQASSGGSTSTTGVGSTSTTTTTATSAGGGGIGF